MKKSLLITFDFPPMVGGVASYYGNLCKYLPRGDIVVLAQKFSEKDDDFDYDTDYKIIRKNLLHKNPFLWPSWTLAIKEAKQAAIQHQCKIFLAGQILPIGTVCYVLKKQLNLPYAVFVHGMDITMPKGRKKLLIKKILTDSSSIIANSIYTKREVVKFGIAPNKISVIYPCPNELPEPKNSEIVSLIEKYKLKEKKILLTVGRLVERKGQDMVIKSLPLVLKKIPNLAYIIIGNGPRLEYLKKLALANNVKNNVIFIPNASDSILADFYKLTDCFIMVSRILPNKDVEGFGIVYLEANSFGKPVIAGNDGGAAEAVIHNQTGLIVNPLNLLDISNAIIKLLTDNNLAARLSFQGLHRAQEEFNYPVQAEKLQNIIDNLNG